MIHNLLRFVQSPAPCLGEEFRERAIGACQSIGVSGLMSGAYIFGITPVAVAQIIPDDTLGAEQSVIQNSVEVRGTLADRIEGGALRDANLFHSFLEFNIADDQRVYFANPVGVENILSRVTGGNPSEILGTLGVDGTADLYLLNPSGIVFGADAQLDIAGSFFASTAEQLSFEDGSEFSAVSPQDTSLLTVSVPLGLQYGRNPVSSTIMNAGNLQVGQDLTLAADRLDLQGQLWAGSNLTLYASDTLRIRDAAEQPFVAAARGDLLVQGDVAVDIFALNHPDSGLYSGGDMVLRSANPVGGDAHYWSGGSFRIEDLSKEAGDLFSPYDPIIRSFGDVVIDGYQGSSLHILAGGSVTLGTAIITAPEQGAIGTDYLQETVTLSDGTVIEIDGGAQPTLDIRAGVSPDAIGTPPFATLAGFDPAIDAFFGNAFDTPNPSTADITIGDVFIAAPNGLVLITSQYEPNPNTTGGTISITGEGNFGNGIDARGFGYTGGTVFIDSRNDIDFTNSVINTDAIGNVGDITILANDTVAFNSADGSLTGLFSRIQPGGTGEAGDIRITASNLEVNNGAQISTATFGIGNAGNIIINVAETTKIDGVSINGGIPSGIFSIIEENGEGQGGVIQITTENLELTNNAVITSANLNIGNAGDIVLVADSDLEVISGSQISSTTRGVGDAGDIIIEADTARFDGVYSQTGAPSGAFSTIDSEGNGTGGDVRITANNLEVTNNATLSASTLGTGIAGDIVINVAETAYFNGGGGAFSGIQPGGKGKGGNIYLTADNLEVSNGSELITINFGVGDAGDIIIDVTETARFSTLGVAASGISPTGKGLGGDILLTTTNLEITNGAQLSASVDGLGEAGNITITTTELARFDGVNSANGSASGAFSSIAPSGEGTGGNIEVTTTNLEVTNGATLSASVFGLGEAGNVIINVAELAQFDGVGLVNDNPSGAFSSIQPGGKGTGGNVEVITTYLEVTNGAQIGASVFGFGEAGNIIITATELARFDGFNLVNGSPSGVFSSIAPNGEGMGGNVEVTTANLKVTNGAQINAGVDGLGEAGNIIINVTELARFDGFNSVNGGSSGAFSSIAPSGEGTGGNVEVTTTELEVTNGARLSASVDGLGVAGNIIITATELARFDGIDSVDGSPSGAFSSIAPSGEGTGGNVEVTATNLEVANGATLNAGVDGLGEAGNIIINVTELARFDGFNSVNGGSSGAFSSIAPSGEGTGGNVEVTTTNLEVTNGAQLATGTLGLGNAGNISIEARETVIFRGFGSGDNIRSGAFSSVEATGEGIGGDINILSTNLEILSGARLVAVTLGNGDAGNISVKVQETARFNDFGNNDDSPGGAFSSVEINGIGDGGNLQVITGNLEVLNGAQLSASTLGNGNAGNIFIEAGGTVRVDGFNNRTKIPSGVSAISVVSDREATSGSINIQAVDLELTNTGFLSSASAGNNDAGNVNIRIREQLFADNGTVEAVSISASGGQILIDASDIRLYGDSDIVTFVGTGIGTGGNIDITADSIIAFDDSDILAFAQDGQGGNVTLDTPAFFGENYQPAPPGTNPFTLDNNDRVDINASGAVAGVITIPDVSFIENSLTDLPEIPVNTDSLIAGSCIARSQNDSGSFIITGAGGLPERPGSATISDYSTGEVRSIPTETAMAESTASWQLGEPIQEPQGVYQLADGRLVMSRECVN